MSTKTIAVESSVYARLANQRRESESFTKVIARLLSSAMESHTGRHISEALQRTKPLADSEAETMGAVVQENRDSERWDRHDLR